MQWPQVCTLADLLAAHTIGISLLSLETFAACALPGAADEGTAGEAKE